MKRNRKKALSLLLALVLLCLCSCARPDEALGTGEPALSQSETTEETAETVEETAAPTSDPVETEPQTTAEEPPATTAPVTTAPATTAPAATAPATTRVPATTKKPACLHYPVKLKGFSPSTSEAEGYSGDHVCAVCGAVLAKGKTMPKTDGGLWKVSYEVSDGVRYELGWDVDPFAYTIGLQSYPTAHFYAEAEMEIFRLCNEARVQAGLQPLTWFEDAYCFTMIRAKEINSVFSHTRPDGRRWNTVYYDGGVVLNSHGENLSRAVGYSASSYARACFDSWMNSESHRQNILYPSWTKMTIAIYPDGGAINAAQHFF